MVSVGFGIMITSFSKSLAQNTGLSFGGKHGSNQQLTAIAETLMITLVLM